MARLESSDLVATNEMSNRQTIIMALDLLDVIQSVVVPSVIVDDPRRVCCAATEHRRLAASTQNLDSEVEHESGPRADGDHPAIFTRVHMASLRQRLRREKNE